jgi:hypothetical protein
VFVVRAGAIPDPREAKIQEAVRDIQVAVLRGAPARELSLLDKQNLLKKTVAKTFKDNADANAGRPVVPLGKIADKIKLGSLRLRALFHFIKNVDRVLAIRGGRQAGSSVFHYPRFKFRYEARMQDTKGDDDAAMVAGSPQDNQMMEVFQSCFLHIGYGLMRALSLIREMGSQTTANMGVLAFIVDETLTSQLIQLVFDMYIDTRVFCGVMVQSQALQLLHMQTEKQSIDFFIAYDGTPKVMDILKQPFENYQYMRLAKEFADEIDAEEQAVAAMAWPKSVSFMRLLVQATRTPVHLDEATDFVTGVKASLTASDGVAHVASIVALALRENDEKVRPLTLRFLLSTFGLLYNSACIVINNISQAHGDRDDTAALNRVLSEGLISQMKLIEAITLQYAIHAAIATRSDARVLVMKRMNALIENDYLHLC